MCVQPVGWVGGLRFSRSYCPVLAEKIVLNGTIDVVRSFSFVLVLCNLDQRLEPHFFGKSYLELM